jgi:microcystin degradation protein MlrC
VFHGFPFADVPDAGLSVVCITDGDEELARGIAAEVGTWVWDHREEFRPESHLPETAIRMALAEPAGPVVVNDTSDNSGGGAPGDGTHLLRALLEADRGAARCAFGSIFDPGVADLAHSSGVGSTIEVDLGGKHDTLHGEPLRVRAYVKALTDGVITLTTPMGAGLEFDMGRCARLVVDGVDIVVASNSLQTLDDSIFLLHGIDVRRCQVVALKSTQHFRAGFRDIATAIVTADAPGLTGQRTELLERQRARRAMWPRDPAATYEAGEHEEPAWQPS